MKNNLVKILLFIVAIETGLIVYLLVQLQSKNETIVNVNSSLQQKSNEVEDKTKELEILSSDLERVKAEREKLGLANDSLDLSINELKTTIAQIKKTNKLDKNKMAELNSFIARLKEEIIARDKEIAVLKDSNDSLQTSVNNISMEKAKLGDSLSNVRTQKKDYESKLAYASILKADNMEVTVLKSNGKEISDSEYKASKIDRIRVKFKLADNKAAKTGTKDFYLRLKMPDGDVFTDPNNGGGYFNLADGTPLSYSMKQTAEFNNQNEKVEITSFSGLKFVPGFYKIEIYCDGNRIGETSLKVK